MILNEGFDNDLRLRLSSGRYNLSQITRDTKVSRYVLNMIKRNVYVKQFYIVALNDYFKNLERNHEPK